MITHTKVYIKQDWKLQTFIMLKLTYKLLSFIKPLCVCMLKNRNISELSRLFQVPVIPNRWSIRKIKSRVIFGDVL